MAKTKNPTLMDVTVKEGGFAVHHHLLLDQVADLARELERARVPFAEICHGRGIGGKKAGYPALHSDKELLMAARQAAPGLKLCVYISSYPYSLLEIEDLKEHFDLGRVGVNVHEVKLAEQPLKRLRSHGKKALAQILRAHARSPKEAGEAAKALAEMGAEVIYLTDSFGSMGPDEVRSYMEALAERVSLPLGFQGRNATGRAVHNSLVAWEAGAQWLDGALMGMGQGAGVTPLEVLVSVLQRQDEAMDLDLAELCNAVKFNARPAFHTHPMTKYMDLLLAKHRLDFYPQEILAGIAHILEINTETLLTELKKRRPEMVQLRQKDLEDYLAGEKLDFQVVMEYLKTGNIPGVSEST